MSNKHNDNFIFLAIILIPLIVTLAVGAGMVYLGQFIYLNINSFFK